jgi:hypothetical protein
VRLKRRKPDWRRLVLSPNHQFALRPERRIAEYFEYFELEN